MTDQEKLELYENTLIAIHKYIEKDSENGWDCMPDMLESILYKIEATFIKTGLEN